MDQGFALWRRSPRQRASLRRLDEDTYPVVGICSEVPDYLSLIIKDGFGLDFEATRDRQVFPLWESLL